jgi:F-type H+-transporting ATPase subunit b
VSLDLSVLWIIGFVLLLIAVVNRLLFKPLLNVMHQRDRAVSSARELAERATADAAAAALEFEARTRAARAEVQRTMDDVRKTADALDADSAAARERLAAEAMALGDVVVERVLGRPVSQLSQGAKRR